MNTPTLEDVRQLREQAVEGAEIATKLVTDATPLEWEPGPGTFGCYLAVRNIANEWKRAADLWEQYGKAETAHEEANHPPEHV